MTKADYDLRPLLGAKPSVAWDRKIHFISVHANGLTLLETKEYHQFSFWLFVQDRFLLIGRTNESILRGMRKFSPEEFFGKLVPQERKKEE